MKCVDRVLWVKIFRGLFSLFVPRIKILTYHSISPYNYDAYEVRPEVFEAHLSFLANSGYHVISLRQAVSDLQFNCLSPKSVAITFDDGYKTFEDFAFPTIRKFNFPVHVFLPIGLIGNGSHMSVKKCCFNIPLLDWEGIQRISCDIITFGSHSMFHRDLRKLALTSLKYELQESLLVLEKGLGNGFYSLAYPYGLFNSEVKDAAKEVGFQCAFGFGNIMSNTYQTDIFELKREKITNKTGLKDFRQMVDVKNDFHRKIRFSINQLLKNE